MKPARPIGETGKDRAESGAASRRDAGKLRDAALILPIAGMLLLMPPVLALFETDDPDIGGPPVAIYVFAVWAILIACSYLLSRHLRRDDETR